MLCEAAGDDASGTDNMSSTGLKSLYGPTRLLGPTRCNNNVLLLLHGSRQHAVRALGQIHMQVLEIYYLN
jgi:hypothetical protein